MNASPARRWALALLVTTAACSSQVEPARRSLGEIQGALGAASADAAVYVPAELNDTQERLHVLEQAFDRHDYGAVVAGAPAVLRAAQDLVSEAAAAKAARRRALDADWTGLVATVPERMESIERRLGGVAAPHGAPASRAALAGRETARSALGAAGSLWSKAQAAFAAGNLDEAVATGRGVGAKLDVAAGALAMDAAAHPP